ncbi:MAG: ABC transporter substrate-binding protein, partial [SAR324 cluster bacterium]|nr:ABC transporter substrate-binding protein [SAR324 cluster bacterium]
FTPGSKMKGERNDDYFKPGLPYLDEFEAIFSKKQAVQVAAIRSGRAMGLFRGLPPTAVADIVRSLGKDNVIIQESTWNCALFVTPNSHRKPFDDPRVRRALSLAIDRWGGSRYLSRIAIVKTVGGLVFPGHPLAMSNEELKKIEGFGTDIKANRAKARQLLREAGVKEGFKFTFHNRAVEMPYKIVGTWLIDQWRQIGLEVDQWTQPTAQFYKTLRSNPPGYDVSMDFNCQSIVNPTLDISKFLSWDAGGGSNNGKYIDREIDRLYHLQLRETDPVKQKAILVDFQKHMFKQGWYIPTLWWHRILPLNAKLKGWNITPSHYLNMQLEVVWLDQ